MKKVSWPYFDPDFDRLQERIQGPPCRVSIDNESCKDCTVIMVDSVKKQGILLEVVQVLTDLKLIISKTNISSDASWCMDVFHVKDENGNKVEDQMVIYYIQQVIGRIKGSPDSITHSSTVTESEPSSEHTAITMTGTDRPGLFSDLSATLTDLHCNIVEAHAWSQNTRLACVAYVSDEYTETPISDPHRLAAIEDQLTTILRAAPGTGSNQMNPSAEQQLVLPARDFDGAEGTLGSSVVEVGGDDQGRESGTIVSIESCNEKGYSVVNVECKDRQRLMFDTVSALSDMEYDVFHAYACVHDGYAFQEYFIRHLNGYTLNTEGEKERLMKCLVAAIERQVSEVIQLRFRANDRVGLLSKISGILRENGLVIVRADIKSQGEKTMNNFYVRDIAGKTIDAKLVEAMERQIGLADLEISNEIQPISSSSLGTSHY